MDWIDKQPYTIHEITTKKPQYARAIKGEITEMEKSYENGDMEGQKNHMLRAQGYYKKAVSLIREAK
ncbi:MAG: hypothetical protein ACYDHW_10890 [Syntrophorhabdaceae bacterium]